MTLEKSFTVVGGLKALQRFLGHIAMIFPAFNKGRHREVIIVTAEALDDFLRTTTTATEEERKRFVGYFVQGIYSTLDTERINPQETE